MSLPHDLRALGIGDDGRLAVAHWPAQDAEPTIHVGTDRALSLDDLPNLPDEGRLLVHDLPASAARLGEDASLDAQIHDTLELALTLWPTALRHDLPGLQRHLELPGCDAAQAEGAAQLTAELARQIPERAAGMPPDLLSMLLFLAGPDVWPEFLRPPDSSPRRARLNTLLPTVPARRERPEGPPSDLPSLTEVSRLFDPEGPLARVHPAYEARPGQASMAQAIGEAFEREELLVVEAGTGTGKSLAYLIPAAIWALGGGRRVVISTNTKNLQEQLCTKDIPLTAEVIGLPLCAAALKGRQNYACTRLAVAAITDAIGSMFRQDRLTAAFLLSWLAQSPSGDLSEISPEALAYLEPLRGLLRDIASDPNTCLGRACIQHRVCRVEAARRRAENADLVVINHALALADSDRRFVPDHHHAIFDEAHNLEDVATDQLALEVSQRSLELLCRKLGEGEARTSAGAIRRRLERLGPPFDTGRARELLDELRPLADQLEDAAEDLGARVLEFASEQRGEPRGEFERETIRLTDEVRALDDWQDVTEAAVTLCDRGRAAGAQFRALAEQGEAWADSGNPEADRLRADAEMIGGDLGETCAMLGEIALGGGPDAAFVSWVEAWATPGGPAWSLRAAPIDVGPSLDAALYQHCKSLIFTSATLTVDGRFDYLRQRLGLDAHDYRLCELAVPSSFDLERQLLLCVPHDIPLPTQRDFEPVVSRAIQDLAERARGRTLALFTSRAMLRRVTEALRPALEERGLTLLSQEGGTSREALLAEFQRDRRTVLCGVKSFWEGVDVPGIALSAVVIVRLPFAVPTDPIIEARCEHLESQGIDSRNEYYTPNAIIGFKQGLGRLIRSTTDRGVVLVLDKRLIVRSYGRRFLDSLGPFAFGRGTLQECLDWAGEWLGGAPAE